MLQSSEWVHFRMQDFSWLHSRQFLPSLFRVSSPEWVSQNLLLPWTWSSSLQWCFRKSSATPAEFAPVIQVDILSIADPCTDGVRTPKCSSLVFLRNNSWEPLAEKTNSNSQVHCVFSFKSSFYLSFLFSDKKLVARPGNCFLVSLFTNTNPLYYCLFPNVATIWSPM